MRFFSRALVVLMLLLSSTVLAQDDITILEVGDSIELVMRGASLQIYTIDLVQNQSILLDWQGTDGTSFLLYRSDDQQILARGRSPHIYRIIIPSDNSYTLEISNNNDTSEPIFFQISSVPTQDIAIGDTYILEDDIPFIELNLEGNLSDIVGFDVQNVRYSLERFDNEDDIWINFYFHRHLLNVLDASGGFVFDDDARYRLVVMPLLEQSDDLPRRISLTQPEPITDTINFSDIVHGEANNTLVEYTITLEQYQAISVRATTQHGSQIWIYDPNGNVVNLGMPNFNSALREEVTQLIAEEAGQYRIRVLNPLSGFFLNDTFALTVEELPVYQLTLNEAQTVSPSTNGTIFIAEVSGEQSYEISAEGHLTTEELVIYVYDLPFEFLNRNGGTQFDVSDDGLLAIIVYGQGEDYDSLTVTLED